MDITVFKIVNIIQQFHSDLADYYFAQKENSYDTRVLALLDFLGKSERYLEKYVDNHRLELSREMLNEKISLPAGAERTLTLKLKDSHLPDILDNYDSVLAFAIKTDSMLVNFCKEIKSSTNNPVVSKAFYRLCKVTRREKRNLYSYNNIFAD